MLRYLRYYATVPSASLPKISRLCRASATLRPRPAPLGITLLSNLPCVAPMFAELATLLFDYGVRCLAHIMLACISRWKGQTYFALPVIKPQKHILAFALS